MALLLLLVSLAVGAQESAAPAYAAAAPGGKPVTIAGALEYDFTSRLNARPYRLFVYLPPELDPALSYPVLYVLDANFYFATGTDMLRRLVRAGQVAPALLVGIGYPGEAGAEWTARRTYDLTPSRSIDAEETAETGGADLFLRVIEEEIRPFIAARHNVDTGRQGLFGHSYAGLFVLHTLFTRPEAFASFISSSPSLWYNAREVLNSEAAFSARVQAGEINAGLLLSSAGDEQYRGADPGLIAADTERMVDNAAELAARLGALATPGFQVERVIFTGETHDTVPFVALNRALRFALPVE